MGPLLVQGPKTRALGRLLELHAELGSTNDRARTLARQGAEHGLAILADRQTRGRGQRGRVWDSPEGAGLYVSFLTRPRLAPRAAPGLTLLSGLALYEAVRETSGAALAIKWPNDLLAAGPGPLAGRKLGGILVEAIADAARVDHAVIGIGLNLRDRPWPAELEPIATSVAATAGRDLDRATLYAALCEALETLLDEAEADGLHHIFRRVARVLAGRGERVALELDGQRVEGELVGVAEDGALLLDTTPNPAGVTAFHRGELRLSRSTQIRG